MEDLWCFNEEPVARAIYDSGIPVISAVGHEPDVTIADYVADARAATPSNGAELAVPDAREQSVLLGQLSRRMGRSMEARLEQCRSALKRAGQSPAMRSPMGWVDQRRELLDRRQERLCHAMARKTAGAGQELARLAAGLDAMSPLKVLGRGYAIAAGPKGVVRSVGDVEAGDSLRVRVSDGEILCEVQG